MATKKKAPADAAPAAEAKPARKFPAGARKKKTDAPVPAEVPATADAPTAGDAAAPDAVAPAAHGPSTDAIRARAWAIWRMYGGSPMQNWLRAEAELREEAAKE